MRSLCLGSAPQPDRVQVLLEDLVDASAQALGRVVLSVQIATRKRVELAGGDRESIVVTELPFQVNKARLIEQIAKVDGVDGVFIGPSDLAASLGETSVLKTKSRSVARLTPLTSTMLASPFTMRRAASVALPAGRSVKMTCAPVRVSSARIAVSMSSGVSPIMDKPTNLPAIPQI